MGVRRIAAVARRWQIRLHFFLPLQHAMNKPILSVVPLLLLAAAGWVQAQESPASTARAGTMKVVQGQAQVTDARGSRALQPGDAVASADSISTGANSAASVVLRDGTTMVLGANSHVDLKNFTYDATTQEGNVLVSVLRGSMRMLTGLIGKTRPDAIKVTTPTSTIGILGTDFIVEVAEGKGN